MLTYVVGVFRALTFENYFQKKKMCQVEVVVGTKQESVFLVFEYCEHDLATLLDSSAKPPFTV